MISEPSAEDSTENLKEKFPCTFPECAVTCARAKKNIANNESDLDLSETFLGHLENEDDLCHFLFKFDKLIVQGKLDFNANEPGESVLNQGSQTLFASERKPYLTMRLKKFQCAILKKMEFNEEIQMYG